MSAKPYTIHKSFTADSRACMAHDNTSNSDGEESNDVTPIQQGQETGPHHN